MSGPEKKICIILNPAAKGERARNLSEKLRRHLPGCRLVLTRRPGHAQELARGLALEGVDTVVAAGGDGTVNEVVNGIVDFGVQLGILPVGTVNVFAMEMGIPADLRQASEIVLEGHVRELDVACANQRHFIQLAGVGFDAETVQATDLNFKKMVGPLSYVLAAMHVAAQKPPQLHVVCDNRREIEGCFVLVGNGRFYGGPFEFFPEADMQDGKMDVCVFKKRTHFDLLRYFQGIMSGSHTRFDDVEYLKARRIVVTADRKVPFEVDGELQGGTPVIFTVKKKLLPVLVPGLHRR